ncbi:hypothetical protein [Pseudomonas putida]|uniref:hypothetical protein n=1 Tax=Pseudomonas putida TaxID=303 RepID=UPI000EF7588D|nr:hypothetical protein [Pseudomonas putida]AYN11770.1 hypothetical protein CHN49_18610 [Pseudomonas putida]
MRINWMVPLRALWRILKWILSVIDTLVGLLITSLFMPVVAIVLLMRKGAQRIGRMVKRAMRSTDHDMTDVSVENRWMYGQVDGDMSAFGMFAELHYDVRLSRDGMIVKSRDGKTFLVKQMKKGQSPAELAPLLAEAFLR